MSASRIDVLGGSLTEGWRALDHFTDRFAAIRLFAGYLHEEQAPPSVLFFHGDGGNGKSLLLRYLRSNCCKRMSTDNWAFLRELADDDFADQFVAAEDAVAVPAAAVDFGLGTEDVVGLLHELRRELAPHGFRFPLFTFACIQYWKQAGELSQEKLRRVFPDDEFTFAVAIADALGQAIPFAALFLAVRRLADRHFGPWFEQYRLRRGLDEAMVDAIGRLDYRTELVQNLPALFAEDLNAGMRLDGVPSRVVLFFDTYERFWGEERTGDVGRHFDRDAWFRRLLNALDRSTGIVTVVAGREAPLWNDVPVDLVAEVDLLEIGDFADADALAYLERAGIGDPGVQPRLLDLARTGVDLVHPFLLGLVADVALAAERANVSPTWGEVLAEEAIADRGALLIHRLLRYVDDETAYAVRALCACRSFDYETYRLLGQERGFAATRPRFDGLIQFSFVRRLPTSHVPKFRLHDLLRRLAHQRKDDETLAAHAVLEASCAARVEDDAQDFAEAIYHGNHIAPERGARAWMEAMEEALRAGRLGRCRALIDVLDELVVPTHDFRGRMSYWVGQYATLVSDYARAEASYRQGLDELSRGHDEAPEDVGTLRRQGVVWNGLGILLTRLARYDEARAAYESGISVLDEAMRRDPAEAETANVKGAVLQSLGLLWERLGRRDDAEKAYRASVAAAGTAVAGEPDSASAWNNKGATHLALAMLLTGQNRFPQALDDLSAGVDAFDHALDLAPSHLYAQTNRAFGLSALGDLQAKVGRSGEAIAAYRESVAGYDAALAVAPDSIPASISKGETLLALGEMEAAIGRAVDATVALQASIAALDEALDRAPAHSFAHTHKGKALTALASVQRSAGDDEAAGAGLEAARASFDQALAAAPDHVSALIGKAWLLELAAHGRGETDADADTDAVVATELNALIDRASMLAPEHPEVRSLLELVRRRGAAAASDRSKETSS